MNSPRPSPSAVHLSLRELLLALAFVAVACAALKHAGDVWWALLSAALLLAFLAAAVVAVVGRGPGQARAIGFVLCVTIYIGLTITGLLNHGLPTFALLNAAYPVVATTEWLDLKTGRVISEEQALNADLELSVGSRQLPEQRDFFAVGHLLWAVTLGYLGSRFAGWVYARRLQREERPPAG
jgi:hypothetical protein